MASAAPPVTPVKGYPVGVIPDVDPKFICSQCKLILREPIQSFCGHRFCKECVNNIISQGVPRNTCPLCKEEDTESEFSVLNLDKTFPDNAIKREFNVLDSRCVNDGCRWQGKFNEYVKVHEKACEFKPVLCECGSEIGKPKLAEHKQTVCPLRSVHCPYCTEMLAYQDVEMHNKECTSFPITCGYCEKKGIPRNKIDEHVDSIRGDCTKPVPCPYCDKTFERNALRQHLKEKVDEHLESLRQRVVTLEAGAGRQQQDQRTAKQQARIDELERKVRALQIECVELRSGGGHRNQSAMQYKSANKMHDRDDVAVAASAPFPTTYGRSKDDSAPVVPKSNDSGHRNQSAVQHRSAKEMFPLRDDVAVAAAAPFQTTYARSKDDSAPVGPKSNDSGAADVESMQSQISTYEEIVAVLNKEVESCLKQIAALEQHRLVDEQTMKSYDDKLRGMERSLALKDVGLAEQGLRLESLESVSHDGTLLWKISEFSRRRQDAISGRTLSLYSPLFYTSRNGYKMCARLYLNGDGMGKGTHLSLFFVIMRGNCDAILTWPFRQKVSMMLLDQGKRDDLVDAFRPDPSSSSFRRPQSDMNIASGCPLFVPLRSLEDGKRAFVKDDTVFIKIKVDTSDLG